MEDLEEGSGERIWDDKDLEDVTVQWADKWVFYSPKIVYGLDFDNKEAVDVFMVAKCNSVNPLQFSQMVARTRNIKKLHFWVYQKGQTCAHCLRPPIQKERALLY